MGIGDICKQEPTRKDRYYETCDLVGSNGLLANGRKKTVQWKWTHLMRKMVPFVHTKPLGSSRHLKGLRILKDPYFTVTLDRVRNKCTKETSRSRWHCTTMETATRSSVRHFLNECTAQDTNSRSPLHSVLFSELKPETWMQSLYLDDGHHVRCNLFLPLRLSWGVHFHSFPSEMREFACAHGNLAKKIAKGSRRLFIWKQLSSAEWMVTEKPFITFKCFINISQFNSSSNELMKRLNSAEWQIFFEKIKTKHCDEWKRCSPQEKSY